MRKPSRKYCIDESLKRPKCGLTRQRAALIAQSMSEQLRRPIWVMKGVGGQLVPAGVCTVKRCVFGRKRDIARELTLFR